MKYNPQVHEDAAALFKDLQPLSSSARRRRERSSFSTSPVDLLRHHRMDAVSLQLPLVPSRVGRHPGNPRYHRARARGETRRWSLVPDSVTAAPTGVPPHGRLSS